MTKATSAALLFFVFGAFAFAAPLSDSHPDLDAEVRARLAALPSDGLDASQVREERALTRAVTALSDDAASLGASVADGLVVVRALDRLFGEDPAIGPLLDSLVVDLRSDVESRLAALRVEVAPYSAERGFGARARAVGRLADAALAASHGAAGRTRRVVPLVAAARAIVRAEAALERSRLPGGWQVTSSGLGCALAYESNWWDWQKFAADEFYGPFTAGYDPAGPGTFSFTGTGRVGAYGNVTISATWHGKGRGWFDLVSGSMTDWRNAGGPDLPLVSGTVRVVSWDPEHGTFAADIESVRFSDGATTLRIPFGSIRWTP